MKPRGSTGVLPSSAGRWSGILVSLAFLTPLLASEMPRVAAVPEDVRSAFNLSPFYQKFLAVGGMPIVASEKVSDFALSEARFLIEHMIGHRPEVLAAIVKNRVRFAIMASSEFTTDIPEHRDLTPKDYWDWRARGLGATSRRPAVSCGEENLLGHRGDPYSTENILIHEFGHVIHERGMNAIDPTFDRRVREAFEAATRAGLWQGKYAGTNRSEYWAEGVQSWFDTNRENDPEHNHVNTRAELKEHDARLAALLAEVFGDGPWRYTHPAKRTPASPHLAGFDAATAPRFAWPKHLIEARAAYREGAATRVSAATVTLPSLSPAARADWRSVTGGGATTVYFQNASGVAVLIDWIDFSGQTQNYFTLSRGERVESSTYAGHVWRASDESGGLLGYFVAGDNPANAIITMPARRE